MKRTKLESNALLFGLTLFVIQILLLYDIQTNNGGIKDFILQTPTDKIVIVFSPAGVLGWLARHYAQIKEKDGH